MAYGGASSRSVSRRNSHAVRLSAHPRARSAIRIGSPGDGGSFPGSPPAVVRTIARVDTSYSLPRLALHQCGRPCPGSGDDQCALRLGARGPDLDLYQLDSDYRDASSRRSKSAMPRLGRLGFARLGLPSRLSDQSLFICFLQMGDARRRDRKSYRASLSGAAKPQPPLAPDSSPTVRCSSRILSSQAPTRPPPGGWRPVF